MAFVGGWPTGRPMASAVAFALLAPYVAWPYSAATDQVVLWVGWNCKAPTAVLAPGNGARNGRRDQAESGRQRSTGRSNASTG